ncbi:hypothetical protein P280DRAFT_514663 [Massarina eburnea CBS 473.64]|uniref:Uncharacterized protein n=1 Tax=Massarina eburnea CBS 473.64 TaxID=1395130 RepID=A0A6A6S8V2_9PLEO|nr:hypothetical protein P280DRAFT_514663 [Massarina eburnea CBS 473.64]
MDTIPKLGTTKFQVPLRYAASWQFAYYAPSSSVGLTLAFEEGTNVFIICQYAEQAPHPHEGLQSPTAAVPQEEQLKRWHFIHAFKVHCDDGNTNAYLSDNRTRLRVLGWHDRWKRTGTRNYVDLQFEDREAYELVQIELDRKAPYTVVCGNSLFVPLDMIRIFRQVPEMTVTRVQERVDVFTICYLKPTSREYHPEMACEDDDPVKYEQVSLVTGDDFDAYTTDNERPTVPDGHAKFIQQCADLNIKVPDSMKNNGPAIPRVLPIGMEQQNAGDCYKILSEQADVLQKRTGKTAAMTPPFCRPLQANDGSKERQASPALGSDMEPYESSHFIFDPALHQPQSPPQQSHCPGPLPSSMVSLFRSIKEQSKRLDRMARYSIDMDGTPATQEKRANAHSSIYALHQEILNMFSMMPVEFAVYYAYVRDGVRRQVQMIDRWRAEAEK